MFSWKQTRIHADDQARYIKLLWEVEPAIVSFGGDAAGKQADFAEWSRRLNLPLQEANKAGKNTLEELLAGDVRRELVHFRAGSPLLTEMRHLVYLPSKPGKPREVHKHRKVAGVIHGDHCCFIAGTQVTAEHGSVAIEDVPVGMRVHVRDGSTYPVTAAFSVGERPTWRLECSDGSVLIGTADHPIWTARGWIPLASLMPGDTLTASRSAAPIRVLRVVATGRDERVFNLTVEHQHEYFANGVLVSNCDAGRYGFSDLTHYLGTIAEDLPVPGSRAALLAEETKIERDLDRREAEREAQQDEADEIAQEYSTSGEYAWE
jgi:hypothetical protein